MQKSARRVSVRPIAFPTSLSATRKNCALLDKNVLILFHSSHMIVVTMVDTTINREELFRPHRRIDLVESRE